MNASDGEEEDENEFYDAVAESVVSSSGVSDGHFTLNIPTGTGHRRNSSDSSSEPDETTETKQVSAYGQKGVDHLINLLNTA